MACFALYILVVTNIITVMTSHDILIKKAHLAESTLKSLANANRLMLLCLLQEGPKDVSSLVNETGLSQSAVSQHLAKLRKAKVLDTQKIGANVHYHIVDPVVQSVLSILYLAYCHPTLPEENA